MSELTYKNRRRVVCGRFLAYALTYALAWFGVLSFIPWPVLPTIRGLAFVFTLVYLAELLGLLLARGRYIYIMGNGLAFFEGRDLQLCEKMAAGGYTLCHVNNLGFYKFERAQPEDCCYSVDFSDLKSCSEGFNEYLTIFEGGGWQYACSYKTFHYFKAPKGTTPIYTDNAGLQLKHEKMRKISLWCTVIGGVVAVVCFALATTFFTYPASRVVFILLMLAAGAGFGLALAMGWGIILNHRRAVRMRKLQDRH